MPCPRRWLVTEHAPFQAAGEVAVGGRVVIAHPGEQLELNRLVAPRVVEHPIPLARDATQRSLRLGRRLDERRLDRVGLAHERAQLAELGRRGGVQQQRDAPPWIGAVQREAVMQGLDDMPDRLGVEEVDEDPLAGGLRHRTPIRSCRRRSSDAPRLGGAVIGDGRDDESGGPDQRPVRHAADVVGDLEAVETRSEVERCAPCQDGRGQQERGDHEPRADASVAEDGIQAGTRRARGRTTVWETAAADGMLRWRRARSPVRARCARRLRRRCWAFRAAR